MSFNEARRSILKLNNAHFPDGSKKHTICAISRVSDSTEEIKYSRIISNDTSDDVVCIHPLLYFDVRSKSYGSLHDWNGAGTCAQLDLISTHGVIFRRVSFHDQCMIQELPVSHN